ncbi:MAG: cation acetate symporter [Desulfuromonadaceae bacterium]|nr:cation acetate symporter [Desulfuromonas sp.]MDY0185929.1 cation acetate symporter [Desulfuromonadaceae bacterium]
MLYEQSQLAVILFLSVVAIVVGISIQLMRRVTTPAGYFTAGGRIHWGVNGIAFVGDYLSAASFLGIGGMIATLGYDGFLYSVGFLSGWLVALFMVAEPLRRMGHFTFTDAIDSTFNSRGLRFVAALCTIVISVFYLIPQMVGIGALVTPLFGIPHYLGVLIVGVVVTIIVATSGMMATTYVQFIKGILVLVISVVLTLFMLQRGIMLPAQMDYREQRALKTLEVQRTEAGYFAQSSEYMLPPQWELTPAYAAGFVPVVDGQGVSPWRVEERTDGHMLLRETQYIERRSDGTTLYNGAPLESGRVFLVGSMADIIIDGHRVEKTGALGPLEFLRTIYSSTVNLWPHTTYITSDGQMQVFYRSTISGAELFKPGGMFRLNEKNLSARLDFISLMLALVCGTAALPHILIRYYTVPSQAAARKSTIVAIGGIGFFYLLSLFLGFGAMGSGFLNIMDTNMSVPLLARSFGIVLFATVSAVAFTAVLGTVSGLILAASGAVAHDIMDRLMGIQMSASEKVVVARMAAVVVGCVAVYLGIVFEGMNVSYLAGWAFALAAATNLPALLMTLFWRGATSKGVVASMLVGMTTALVLILISPEMYVRYGLLAAEAPLPLNNPALIALPLSWLTLVLVSRRTASTALPTV